MRKIVFNIMMVLFFAVVLGLAGCGGGDDDSNAATALKVSAVDGTWKLTSTTKPVYLENYDTYEFDNGLLLCDGGNLNKVGTFTLNGNSLTYTMTKAWASSPNQTIEEAINIYLNGDPNANKLSPSQTGSAIITINGDTLTWNDISGNTIATFRKYPATASGVLSIFDGDWTKTSGFSNTQLGVFENLHLSLGKINTDNGWIGNSKTGTFTVTGDTLAYSFDTIYGLQNNTVIASIIGNIMTWKDGNGNTLATFTK